MNLLDSIRAKTAEIAATYRKNLEASGSYINPNPAPAVSQDVNYANWLNFGGAPDPARSVPTPTSTPTSTPTPSAAVDQRVIRQAYIDNFTGWDNTPGVRELQQRESQIWIDTGRWDSPEQLALHKLAEDLRSHANPTYGGLPYGPANQDQANMIYPPSTTPGADYVEGQLGSAKSPTNWGNYLTAGIGVFFLFMMVSMFRR